MWILLRGGGVKGSKRGGDKGGGGEREERMEREGRRENE